MSNSTIRKHELSTDKFIFPRGVWECWICAKPKTWMCAADYVNGSILLLCVPCRAQLNRALGESANLKNLPQ